MFVVFLVSYLDNKKDKNSDTGPSVGILISLFPINSLHAKIGI